MYQARNKHIAKYKLPVEMFRYTHEIVGVYYAIDGTYVYLRSISY